MEETSHEINRLLEKASAPSTHAAYRQGLVAFEDFCTKNNYECKYPIKSDLIAPFVAHLSLSGKAFSTAKTYLAALSAKHKLNNWCDPTDSFLIKKLMQGFACSAPSKDVRYPITLQRLQKIVQILPIICSNSFEVLLFKTSFILAFFGFFRISELLGQCTSLKGARSAVQVSDVKVSVKEVTIKLHGSKCDQRKKGEKVIIKREYLHTDVCPVLATSEFLKVRPKSPKCFLVHMNGKQLTQYQFQAILKKAATNLGWPLQNYSSHSFRIGAATTAAMSGDSLETIMKRGRWKSTTANNYIRLDKAQFRE